LRSCLAKNPEHRPTPADVSVLLERLGGRCGTWPQLLPEALEKDLAVREEEADALVSTRVPSPSVPAVSHEPEFGPAPPDAGTAVLPPSDAVRRWVSSRTGRVVAGTTAAALMATAGTFVVQHFSGDDASGGTPSPSSAATSLPAAWAGTWVGTGPGNPTPDSVSQPRTDRFTVTLTLHAAQQGELAGKQVSNVTEVNTGLELGCTETLTLREVRKASMVLKAVTSQPTDPSAELACPNGNVYVVTMTDRDTLSLSDEGDQSAGAPSTLTRR
jgi:hypothetical protein